MKKFIFGLLLGLIIAGSIGVAAYSIASKDVSYDNTNSGATKNNVQGAIDELYEKVNGDLVGGNVSVANWMNEKYTTNTSWTTFAPTVYSPDFFDASGDSLKLKKQGNYRIYYQAASDSVNTRGYVRILINNNQVATCNGYAARCENQIFYYDATLNEDDIITVQGYSSSASYGARVIVAVVKMED